MSVTSVRPGALVAMALAAGLAFLPPSAHAAHRHPADTLLPTPSSAELAESIVTIEPDVAAIEAATEPLETETSDGNEQVLTLNSDILFDFDKAVIPAPAKAKLGEIVKNLPRKAKVAVGGHTDSKGTASRNQALSLERAKAVAVVVKAARPDLVLSVTGSGSADPVAPNTSGGKDDPNGRAKNRRVELRYAD